MKEKSTRIKNIQGAETDPSFKVFKFILLGESHLNRKIRKITKMKITKVPSGGSSANAGLSSLGFIKINSSLLRKKSSF